MVEIPRMAIPLFIILQNLQRGRKMSKRDVQLMKVLRLPILKILTRSDAASEHARAFISLYLCCEIRFIHDEQWTKEKVARSLSDEDVTLEDLHIITREVSEFQ